MSLQDDLIDSRTSLFNNLVAMCDKAKQLEEEAERIRELNRMIVYRIQTGKITDENEVNRAISMLHSTKLSDIEIIDAVWKY